MKILTWFFLIGVLSTVASSTADINGNAEQKPPPQTQHHHQDASIDKRNTVDKEQHHISSQQRNNNNQQHHHHHHHHHDHQQQQQTKQDQKRNTNNNNDSPFRDIGSKSFQDDYDMPNPSILHHHHQHQKKRNIGDQNSTNGSNGTNSTNHNNTQRDPPPQVVQKPFQDLGFQSPNLAATKYCAEDSRRLCFEGSVMGERKPKRWPGNHSSATEQQNGKKNGNKNQVDAAGDIMTTTECLVQQLSQVSTPQCRAFLTSRKTCFDELSTLEICADLLPLNDISDRYLMRRQKLDSRKSRLDLRQKIKLGDHKSNADPTGSKKDGGGDDKHVIEPSPSMSMSSELSGENGDSNLEKMLNEIEAKFEKEKAEALSSSRRIDYFMSLCSAIAAPSSDVARKTVLKAGRCANNSIAFAHLPFGDASYAQLASRKAKSHQRNTKRLQEADKKQKKLLDTLKDRAIRHHLDKMDEQLESGKVASEHELAALHGEDERGKFLLEERKNRAMRRRHHLHRQHQKFKSENGGGSSTGDDGGSRANETDGSKAHQENNNNNNRHRHRHDNMRKKISEKKALKSEQPQEERSASESAKMGREF